MDMRTFLKELWPLTNVRISFLFSVLRINGWNLTKFIMCIDIAEILVGIIMCKIAQIYNKVTALDLIQNFISAQYLKNEWMEDFAYILKFTRSRLGLFYVNMLKFIRVMVRITYQLKTE